MPNPKRRHSNMRRDQRRTHYVAIAPTVSTCSNCQAPVLSHRVCGNCGFYKGEQVMAVKDRTSRKKRTDLDSSEEEQSEE